MFHQDLSKKMTPKKRIRQTIRRTFSDCEFDVISSDPLTKSNKSRIYSNTYSRNLSSDSKATKENGKTLDLNFSDVVHNPFVYNPEMISRASNCTSDIFLPLIIKSDRM